MMGLKISGFLGLFMMLLHLATLRVLAGRHGMDVRSFLGSNFDEQTETLSDSTEDSLRTELLAKESIQEALNLLPPEVNSSFIDCLIRQNFPLPNSSEESLRIWFHSYLESLLGELRSSSRDLAAQPSDDQPPNRRVTLQKSDDTSETQLPAPPQGNNNNAVIIAVALTAAVTAVTVTLVFICYFRWQSQTYYTGGYSMRDDRPLLSLSLSFSGSSRRSVSTPNSILAPPKPLKTDPSQSIHVSCSDDSAELESVNPEKFDFSSSLSSDSASLNSASSNSNSSSSDSSNLSSSPEPSSITKETPAPKRRPPPPPPSAPPPVRKPANPPAGPPPPPPPKAQSGPPPPPPPKGAAPRPPPKIGPARPGKGPPLAPKALGGATTDNANATKTKLKPFFWDKVQGKPDQDMVWDQLKAGSFQFNEEMIESLFGYTDNKGGEKIMSNKDAAAPVRILDPKKSQNLAISLKAMSVRSEEVRDALMEGNELPAELLHILLKMAPTTEEELKIRAFNEPSQLGPAEQFIRAIVDIPFAYPRMEALLFMSSLPEEASSISQSFSTLEIACKELRSSRLFLKLLEAVLKTGNRMNDGTYRGGAQAFKLDTLLKLADVKGTDGKTTLLHFVVLEIIRAEGVRAVRAARESQCSFSSITSEDLFEDLPSDSGDNYRSLGLKVVSGLSGELENVKKAACLDADQLTHTVASLGERLLRTREFLKTKMENCHDEHQFAQSLRGFVEHAEADVTSLLEKERTVRLLVKETTDYFHGNSGKDEGLRLFVIVRDFLAMIDKICREVKLLPKPASKDSKPQRSKENPATSPAMSPARDPRQLLFPAIKDRRMDDSGSDDDDD
ncbi:formin-like protein 11 isoform X2 [Asparagus officinalis]|uniref:formin-like protein 11 isoform X2 n=1 Tax=Asparagus officinalis TaxID=4686 RepID=UPI00098E01CF|nr:formin-like protein 11 isoform X2 [Asparagus officinalis]